MRKTLSSPRWTSDGGKFDDDRKIDRPSCYNLLHLGLSNPTNKKRNYTVGEILTPYLPSPQLESSQINDADTSEVVFPYF